MNRRLRRALEIATKLDSSQTNMVSRSLIYTLSRIREISHRNSADILEQAFVVNREGGAGLNSINYEEIDYSGEFKLLAGSGTDIQEVGSTLTETPNKVWTYAAGMGWTQKDLERAAVASRNGRPLDLGSRKRTAVMRAALKTKNKKAWNNDGTQGPAPGFFDYQLNTSNAGSGFDAASNEDKLAALIAIAKKPEVDTEDYAGEVMVMDTTSHSFMSNPRANTDTSIAQ